MSAEPRDYGEPFGATRLIGNGRIVSDRHGRHYEFDEFYERGISCINALAGIADPEAFVRAADALFDGAEDFCTGDPPEDIAAGYGGNILDVLSAEYRTARGAASPEETR